MTGIPILLVGGYLGAGKTTLINHLLTTATGAPIAAIVNDFGDINIDAALLGSVTENIISLKNGCICCSLQGDLIAALSSVRRQSPAPQAIVVETSGVSNPAEIARALLDPVIFRAVSLDTIVTVVDLERLLEDHDLITDSLWRTQVRAADFLLLTKKDLVPEADSERLQLLVQAQKPGTPIFDSTHGVAPADILFNAGYKPGLSREFESSTIPQFESMSWTSTSPLSLGRFQNVVASLASKALRIKGLLSFVDAPGQPVLFQSVGLRATMARSPTSPTAGRTAEIVFIGRRGELDVRDINRTLSLIELRS